MFRVEDMILAGRIKGDVPARRATAAIQREKRKELTANVYPLRIAFGCCEWESVSP